MSFSSSHLHPDITLTPLQNPENLILEYSGEERPTKRVREDSSPVSHKVSKKNNPPGRPRKGYSNDEEEESEVDV